MNFTEKQRLGAAFVGRVKAQFFASLDFQNIM